VYGDEAAYIIGSLDPFNGLF